jgi:hypothetical protein
MDWQKFKEAVVKDESDDLDLEQAADNTADYLNSLDDAPMKAERTLFGAILLEIGFAFCVFFFSSWILEWADAHFPVGQVILSSAVFALGFLIGFTAFRIYQSRFGNESQMPSGGSSFMSNYESRSRANSVLINCMFATVAGVINVILLHVAFNFLA